MNNNVDEGFIVILLTHTRYFNRFLRDYSIGISGELVLIRKGNLQ